VTFLGRQPFSVVAAELRRSDVFLQHNVTTNLGQVEGWGVASAEAQAAALPVIGTDHGGLRDQIVNGKNGYLVPEGDWRAMGERMIELARNPDLRGQMGDAARLHIQTVGDIRKQIEKLRAVLERACFTDGRRGSAREALRVDGREDALHGLAR
jgi:glycosyltransferase involved in cell wall biosynthesis